LAKSLSKENYTHVYDAHNSTRSWFLSLYLQLTTSALILRKSQKRLFRFLLFQFRINLYRLPRSGQRDLLEPLSKWGIDESLPPTPQLFLTSEDFESVKTLLPSKPFIALAPSAAYELKRWPESHWKKLIESLPQESFVLLGGPEDTFLEQIRAQAPERVFNLAGHTPLRQTAAVVKKSRALIANDTGILHTAEQQGHPTIALMGPAPFGFPSRPSTRILEKTLACRPCSKHGQGPCRNPNFQECLVAISPDEVLTALKMLLKESL